MADLLIRDKGANYDEDNEKFITSDNTASITSFPQSRQIGVHFSIEGSDHTIDVFFDRDELMKAILDSMLEEC